jgi:hypothetical protein
MRKLLARRLAQGFRSQPLQQARGALILIT